MVQCSITVLKDCLQQEMGGNFNPGTEAENQGVGPANSFSDYPLPLKYSKRAIGSLRLTWLLGGPPLDIEARPIRHKSALKY